MCAQTNSPTISLDPSKLSRQPGAGFTPLKKDSPYSPVGVNLTGLPRRVKDSCADLYNNACTRWERAKLQGARTIREIIVLKGGETPDEAKLDELCENLLKIMDDLARIVDSISSVRKNFEALLKIYRVKASVDSDTMANSNVPFLSYTLEKYLEMIRSIEEPYIQELKFKRNLIKRVPLQNNQAICTFINVCWLHDPLIDESVMRTVLALVAECGFK